MKTCKRKKIIAEESEPDSIYETMTKINNCQNSSVDATDNVDSGEGESDREESSRDTNRDDDDPLSLPICSKNILGKLRYLMKWLDQLGLFIAKILL